jgi:hypothetical protein
MAEVFSLEELLRQFYMGYGDAAKHAPMRAHGTAYKNGFTNLATGTPPRAGSDPW